MKGNTKERYGRREGGGRGVEKVEGGRVGEEEEEKRKKRRTIYIYIYSVASYQQSIARYIQSCGFRLNIEGVTRRKSAYIRGYTFTE